MTKTQLNKRTYLTLLLASILTTAASIPYAFTLAKNIIKESPLTIPALTAVSLLQSTVIFAIAIYIGLKLSKKTGLELPIINNYPSPKSTSQLKSILKPSILAGVFTGVSIILLDLIFLQTGSKISLWSGELPPSWMGFLASFYGGIGEEILLRLFFMTLIVWLLSKFKKSKQKASENSYLIWSGIIVSSLLFGLGHLPITASVTPLTTLIITRALILNGIGGVVFGWLYWKKGLESAIIAHFSTDIVLHVIFPIWI